MRVHAFHGPAALFDRNMPSSTGYHPRKTLAALLFFAALVLYPYLHFLRRPRVDARYVFSGYTMGTTYRVRIGETTLDRHALRRLHMDVEQILDAINRQMSTYEPDSEIVRFNASTSGRPFGISREFSEVMQKALAVAALTGGAFDPTVGPLVDLWGFGPAGGKGEIPDAASIQHLLRETGYRHLRLVDSTLIKAVPGLQINLSALAKGYAADRVARWMRDHGCPNVFVEIGGEIVTFGTAGASKPWKIAIRSPSYGKETDGGYSQTILLSDHAVATSGNYENYFRKGSERFSHIIDPRSGQAVQNEVASVSVIAGDCMTADALATALMVMGVEEGLRLVEALDDTEVLFLLGRQDGTFDHRMSSGFSDYTSNSR